MTQTQINRRRALAVVASAPAAAALASVPALANAGEDAELIRLWEDWKAQQQNYLTAYRLYIDADERASEAWRPMWRFKTVCKGSDGCLQAHFTANKQGKPIDRFEIISAVNASQAEKKMLALEKQWDSERSAAMKAAGRKHKVKALDKQARREFDALDEIADRIIDTPADSLVGVAIKLALGVYEDDVVEEPARSIIKAAYTTAANLAAFDPIAQVERP
jgi:hypothetical protein